MAESSPRRFGHEPAMISARPILCVAAILATTVLMTAAVLHWSLRRYVMPHQSEVAARRGAIPPEPRLQANASDDLASFRSQQQAVLSNYAWIDSTHTLARIPIQRAMEVYVQQHGLVSPPGTPARATPDRRQ